ncbi:hypothetical protein ACFU9X_38060 [Streptomyces atratus]|uniref:hypothetical protein n=1 Tax=Streptomyces atratus TaxID=1893 RepID=UPI0036768038
MLSDAQTRALQTTAGADEEAATQRAAAEENLVAARDHAERLVSDARDQVAELTALAAQDREATSTASPNCVAWLRTT